MEYMRFNNRNSAQIKARELRNQGYLEALPEQLTDTSWPVMVDNIESDESWVIRISQKPQYLRSDGSIS